MGYPRHEIADIARVDEDTVTNAAEIVNVVVASTVKSYSGLCSE
jgi:hypothetical protein